MNLSLCRAALAQLFPTPPHSSSGSFFGALMHCDLPLRAITQDRCAIEKHSRWNLGVYSVMAARGCSVPTV